VGRADHLLPQKHGIELHYGHGSRYDAALAAAPDAVALHGHDAPHPHPALTAAIEPSVFEHFNQYYAALHEMTDPRRNLDDRLRGNYGRFSTIALKLALILAIMDWADEGAQSAPRLTGAH
jgi:hypothetical protein